MSHRTHKNYLATCRFRPAQEAYKNEIFHPLTGISCSRRRGEPGLKNHLRETAMEHGGPDGTVGNTKAIHAERGYSPVQVGLAALVEELRASTTDSIDKLDFDTYEEERLDVGGFSEIMHPMARRSALTKRDKLFGRSPAAAARTPNGLHAPKHSTTQHRDSCSKPLCHWPSRGSAS